MASPHPKSPTAHETGCSIVFRNTNSDCLGRHHLQALLDHGSTVLPARCCGVSSRLSHRIVSSIQCTCKHEDNLPSEKLPPQETMSISMPKRALGKDGPLVSALGFGAMGLSFGYGKRESDEEAFAVLDRALELGSTFWDTSDVYADNEDLLRLWFERTGKRNEVFLCSKFGVSKTGIRSDAAYVKEACERSLQRLGVDHIDLYYCHRVDKKTPIEETVKAMAELKKEGKIRHLGLSEISASTLKRAHAVHPIAAVQMEYSAFALDIERPETDFLKTCRELGVAVVAYSPLGRGLLTGQLKSSDDFPAGDFRATAPRYDQSDRQMTSFAHYHVDSARRISTRILSLQISSKIWQFRKAVHRGSWL